MNYILPKTVFSDDKRFFLDGPDNWSTWVKSQNDDNRIRRQIGCCCWWFVIFYFQMDLYRSIDLTTELIVTLIRIYCHIRWTHSLTPCWVKKLTTSNKITLSQMQSSNGVFKQEENISRPYKTRQKYYEKQTQRHRRMIRSF